MHSPPRLGIRRHTCVLALAWSVSSALAPRAGALAPFPAGGQFQVNSYTTSNQFFPSVAAAADGDFVVVWNSFGSAGTDTSNYSIQGQRHASNGSTQGAQFQVNSYTTGAQFFPSVAAAAGGDFTVVWASSGSSGTDTSGDSIQGRRYASDGSAQGTDFQVNTYTTSIQASPSVAAAADGKFVVVWQSSGSSGTDTSLFSIQGQRYASSGSPQGGQFQVNSYTTSDQIEPAVAIVPDGDFVVVWRSAGSSGTDTNLFSIQAQRYASDGSAQGAQFQVNTYTTGNQTIPSMAAGVDGSFVAVWTSDGSFGTDADESIQGQRYASSGSPQGGQFQVNTYTTYSQFFASVAAAGDSDFVVVWSSFGSAGADSQYYSIQGRHYSNGSPQASEIQINSYGTNTQLVPAVATAADGDFVVVWGSYGSPETDTGTFSIQGQRYAAPPPVPAMSLETRGALAAALLLLGGGLALRQASRR